MRLALGLVSSLLVALASGAARADPPRLRAVERAGPIAVDGRLDEASWAAAPVGDDFVERVPDPGAPAPVRTTVRVLYDADAIYVGVEAFLAPGERPRALELTRDAFGIFEDDAISVKVDARRDGRTTLGFVVNPAGAQLDYLAVDNGASFRREHDMVWESATDVGEDRWTVEMRLPVTALGLSAATDARAIGMNVTRDHNARAATYDWSPTRPEFGPFSALHYGVVEGVRSGGGGVPAMVTFYSLGEYQSVDAAGVAHALRGAVGADGWVRLAADTWLEATALTDFSQVDLDDALVNLDRFPLFFPERRPFFINGLDVFAAGVAQTLQPFYSRRIGLAPDGRQLPVLGGLKLYGREGPVSFGVLDVLTDASDGRPATNDAAARIRYSLDGRASYVGLMATSRTPFAWEGPALSGGAHVTYAADMLTRVADERIEVYGFGAGTARDDGLAVDGRPIDGGEGAAAAVSARYRGEVFQPSIAGLWAGPGFEPELGFVRRPSSSQLVLALPFVARPGGDFRRLSVTASGELQGTADFRRELLVRGSIDLELEVFDGGWVIGAGADYLEDTVRQDFEIVPGVIGRQGTWVGARLDAWLRSPGQRNPVVELYYAANNAYFGGMLHNPAARLRARIGPHFSFDVSADVYRVELPAYAPFWTAGVNALLRVTPSTTLQIDALGRLDTESERATAMLRLRWRYWPGSDLYVVWREDIRWEGGAVTSERTVTVKTTLRFDVLL